eukprot:m51a1_g11636 hypothetical protein (154) ;mRNA; f:4792-5527
MSTTSFLLTLLALVACAIAQFDCIMYGDRVAIYSTYTGFYLTATGGKSASPADAVALRITPTNPWRVGQPLLKGDNFLLLNGTSMSATGSPVSYSEIIGVTLGGLAQGGVSTQQNPENSNRRYITIPPPPESTYVMADWWRGWELLRFKPVQP